MGRAPRRYRGYRLSCRRRCRGLARPASASQYRVVIVGMRRPPTVVFRREAASYGIVSSLILTSAILFENTNLKYMVTQSVKKSTIWSTFGPKFPVFTLERGS